MADYHGLVGASSSAVLAPLQLFKSVTLNHQRKGPQMSLMLQRCIDPASVPVLVDLGSVDDQRARDNADALVAAGVSRKNLSVEGCRRLLIKLPPKKAAALLTQFPIVVGVTYWKCTHHWPLATK